MTIHLSMRAAISAGMLALALPGGVRADQVITDDLIVGKGGIEGTLLCVGSACVNGETFDNVFEGIFRLKGVNNVIEFHDTSSSAGIFPDRDWAIQANDTAGTGDAGEAFFIRDVTAGSRPFYLEGDAPNNALFIESATGNVGLGTSLPQDKLHITSAFPATGITLETTNITPARWEMDVGPSGYSITDDLAGTFPVVIKNGAPDYALWVESDGRTGLGTQSPEGKLHVKGNGVQLSYLESGDGGAVQLRFRTNSENRRFLAVNNLNQVKSQIVFGDNQIQFLGQTIANEWLRISDAGIVSSGPTCNPNPCDATFDPEVFTVPPIEERAAYMWENQHLPAIGPTEPGQPFNLTEKTAGMLHELEIAHIYIADLHERLEAQDAEKAQMQAVIDAQGARLDALERIITPQ